MLRTNFEFADQIQESKINPAWRKMIRIGDLWERVNNSRINPLLFNHDTNSWNYEIWFSSLNSLMQEGSAKFEQGEDDSTNERDRLKNKMKVIYLFMKRHPIYTHQKKMNGNKEYSHVLNTEAWEVLKRELEEYEFMIRESLDLHGLDTPNKNWDDEGL